MWGKVVAGVALVVAAGLALADYSAGKQSSALLEIGESICTGTVVGKTTILTAYHCFGGHNEGTIALDQGPVQPYRIVANDDNDHVLVRVTTTQGKRIAPLGAMPSIGQPVYLWGNPHGVREQLRVGYVQGYVRNFWGLPAITVFSFFTQPGDSGAGYFNSRGEVVAVHWGRHPDNAQAIAFRLQFSAKQWRENVK